MDVFQDFINNNLAGFCSRCGTPCVMRETSHPDARLLRRADKASGVCASCAITQFIKSSSLMIGIERNGVDTLLHRDVQEVFTSLLCAGNSDSDGSDIDWQRVVDNWSLE